MINTILCDYSKAKRIQMLSITNGIDVDIQIRLKLD